MDRQEVAEETYRFYAKRVNFTLDQPGGFTINGLQPTPVLSEIVVAAIITNDTLTPATSKQLIFSNTLDPLLNQGIRVTAGSGDIILSKAGVYEFKVGLTVNQNCSINCTEVVDGVNADANSAQAFKIGADTTAPMGMMFVHGQPTDTPTTVQFFLKGDSYPTAGTAINYTASEIFITHRVLNQIAGL